MQEIITEAELLEAKKLKFTGPKHIERTQNGKRISYTIWYVNGEPVSHHDYKVHHQRMKHLGHHDLPSPQPPDYEHEEELRKYQRELDAWQKARRIYGHQKIREFEKELKDFEKDQMTPEKLEKHIRESMNKILNKRITDKIQLKASKLDEPEYQALIKTFPADFYKDGEQLNKLNTEMDRVLEKKYGTSDLTKIYDVDLKRAAEISAEFTKSLRPGISRYFTEMCLKAALNRGYDPKTAMDTAYWLAFTDLGYKSTASEFVSGQVQDKLHGEIGEPLGRLLGAASRNLPIAQIGYLAYSGILNPVATLRAVRDVTLGVLGKDVLPSRSLVGPGVPRSSMFGLGTPNPFGYTNEFGMFGLPPDKVRFKKKKPKQITRERFTPLVMEMHARGYPTRSIARAVTKEAERLGLPGISHQTAANIIKGKPDDDDIAGDIPVTDQGASATEYDEAVNYVNKRLRQELGGRHFADGEAVDFRNMRVFNSFANAFINDKPVGNQVAVHITELPRPIELRVSELEAAVKRTIGLGEDKSKLQTFNELQAVKNQAYQFNKALQRIDSDIRKSGRVTPDAVFHFINHNRETFYDDLMQAMNNSNAVDADVWLHINGQPVPVSRAAVAKVLSMQQKMQALNGLSETLEPYRHEMIQFGGMYGHTEPTTMEVWPALKSALLNSSPGQSTVEVRLPGVEHLVPFDREEVRQALSLGDVVVREAFSGFTEQVTKVHGTSNGTLIQKRLINEQLIDWNSMLEKARKLRVKK